MSLESYGASEEAVKTSYEKKQNNVDLENNSNTESLESSTATNTLIDSLLCEDNNTSLAVKHFFEGGKPCINVSQYEKEGIDPLGINSGTKHIVTDAELVFTFCKLYELFKTNTSVVVQYLKNNFMDANDRQNPGPKIKNFLVTLEKTVGDYKFDMDMQGLPCFGYLSSDKLIISNDVKVVIKMLNGGNNQLDQPFGQPGKLGGLFSNDEEPRPSSRNSSKSLNNEKVKGDFDELSNNQLVNDNGLNSKPRYTLCTIKGKTIQISPLYVSEDYESLKMIILEKGKHRNSTFDDIVGATTKVTSSLSNVALGIGALNGNIVTSIVKPIFKNDGKGNNNSDNIPEPKDKLPN